MITHNTHTHTHTHTYCHSRCPSHGCNIGGCGGEGGLEGRTAVVGLRTLMEEESGRQRKDRSKEGGENERLGEERKENERRNTQFNIHQPISKYIKPLKPINKIRTTDAPVSGRVDDRDPSGSCFLQLDIHAHCI